MKTCFKCKCEKPRTEFYVHKMMTDGLLGKCKECTKADVHAHRHGSGRERVLAYDRSRAYRPDGTLRAKQQPYDPVKESAHRKLSYAVQKGWVKPWPVCCVPTCNSKPEAHHWDYSKPLDVIWLCSAHHKQTHAISGAYK